MTNSDKVMNVKEAAAYFGVNPETLRRWGRNKRGPRVGIDQVSGRYFYRLSWLDRWLDSLPNEHRRKKLYNERTDVANAVGNR